MHQQVKFLLLTGAIFVTLVTLLYGIEPVYDTFWQDTAKPVINTQPVAKNEPKQAQIISKKAKNKDKKYTPPLFGTFAQKLADNEFAPAYFTEGFDWSLPEGTPIEPYSGLIDEYDANLDYIHNRFNYLRWDEINPAPGVYNFSKFDRWLTSIGSARALIRLEVHSACEAPGWANKKLRHSKKKSLIFWDKAYIEALRPLIRVFAKRYAADPKIIGVQLGIGDGEYNGDCDFDNKDGWGEMWMSPTELAEAKADFGFTPQRFEQSAKQIIDLYVDAFGKHRGKLAYTGLGSLFSWNEGSEPYNKVLQTLSYYALNKGTGNRDGQVEVWLRYLEKVYGEKIISLPDGTCALDFDEDFANKIRGRYWGTENEFYGRDQYILDFHGPYKNQPYRFMVSSLRALQMRRNFFSLTGSEIKLIKSPTYKTQAFLDYLTKVMGKQIENTPDAFILLGERYVTPSKLEQYKKKPCVANALRASQGKVAIRSFGRWLKEASQSKAALKINMPESENYWGQDMYLPDGVDYEYAARSGNRFDFDLNDQLSQKRCQTGCKTQIKLTFRDDNKTQLMLQVAEGTSQGIQTRGDHKIRTLTFNITSAFNNGLQGKDFRILTSAKSLSLVLVRVNFLD